MKTTRYGIFSVVLLGTGIAGLVAQPMPRAPETTPPPAIKKSPRVWFRGDLYSRDDAQKTNTGKGNVVLRLTREEMPDDFRKTGKDPLPLLGDDSRLTTEFATYNETSQVASAPGKVKLEDQYDTLTGNTGTAFYKTRDAKIRGDVQIVALPRDDNKTAAEGSATRQFDAPITLTCQKLDYNWRTKIGLASEQLTIKQKDRVVTADKAIYDGKQQIIILDGNVVSKRPNGESGVLRKATIYFTKGKERFLGEEVKVAYPVDEAELNGEEKPAPDAGATPSTPPATPPKSPENTP